MDFTYFNNATLIFNKVAFFYGQLLIIDKNFALFNFMLHL